jgi:hypothetical protein
VTLWANYGLKGVVGARYDSGYLIAWAGNEVRAFPNAFESSSSLGKTGNLISASGSQIRKVIPTETYSLLRG